LVTRDINRRRMDCHKPYQPYGLLVLQANPQHPAKQ